MVLVFKLILTKPGPKEHRAPEGGLQTGHSASFVGGHFTVLSVPAMLGCIVSFKFIGL